MSNWNTDAQFVHELSDDCIFINGRIASFLRESKVFLVVASKGMGKTLLLRYKRSKLEGEQTGVTIVPRDSNADYVKLPASLAQNKLALMHEYEFWRDLWEISIAVSALVHFPHTLGKEERRQFTRVIEELPLPTEIRDNLLASARSEWYVQLQPSDVLNILLQSSHKTMLKVPNTCLHPLFDLFREYIKSGMALFIDSFDQALSDRYPDDIIIWLVGQHGLLKAAWEMSRQNSHVKIYTAIRQEAWSAFKGAEKANMYGSTLLIEYDARDLKDLMTKAVKYYEHKDSIDEFIGLDTVDSDGMERHETAFNYLFRHSLGVPRWLMVLGEEISFARPAGERKLFCRSQFRSVVNRVAATRLAKPYLDSEMRSFLVHGYHIESMPRFLRLINSNVLTYKSVCRITERFNEQFHDGIERHPFCALYNLGLLGVVTDKPDSQQRIQSFRKPYEFESQLTGILPVHPQGHYLLHPALNVLIKQHNAAYTVQNVRIGDCLPWTRLEDEKIYAGKISLFISYAHEDLEMAEDAVKYLEDKFNDSSFLYDIWFDRYKMVGGKLIRDQIEKGVRECDYMLLLLSGNSLRSEYVRFEWKMRLQQDQKNNVSSLVPLMLDDFGDQVLPTELRQMYCYDLSSACTRRFELQRLYEALCSVHSELPSTQKLATA